MALFAGDVLALHFEVMLREESIAKSRCSQARHPQVGILGKAIGADGMVGGQVIDLLSEGKQISLETLRKMDEGKTGADFSLCTNWMYAWRRQ